MPFVRAYPRESQEMVFDAHIRAFEFFKGCVFRTKSATHSGMKSATDSDLISAIPI
jgi:transposase